MLTCLCGAASSHSKQKEVSEPKPQSSTLPREHAWLSSWLVSWHASLFLMLASWKSLGLQICRWDSSLAEQTTSVILYLLNIASAHTEVTGWPQESVLSFYLVGPRDWIQGDRFGSRCHYTVTHLASLCFLCCVVVVVLFYSVAQPRIYYVVRAWFELEAILLPRLSKSQLCSGSHTDGGRDGLVI